MKLQELGIVPFMVSVLESVFPSKKAIVSKANRLEDSNEIIRLKRGLYVVAPEVSGKRLNEFLIANHIYGPSYVSMQTALRYYGLIPERVYEIMSMTTGLHKTFTNNIAVFSYIHCPAAYYNIGIDLREENDVHYMIASPEKALCDMLIYTSNLNLRYMGELVSFLENNIRFDMDSLSDFNIDLIRKIRDNGRKKAMLTQLIKLIEDERGV